MIWLFKTFLLSCVILFTYLVIFRLRTILIQRLLSLALCALLCFLIVEPDSYTRVARLLGIGRGADLLFYVAHVTEAYLLLILYARYQRVANALTGATRRDALLTAQTPGAPPPKGDFPA